MVKVTNKHCYEELWMARGEPGRTVMCENKNNLCAAEAGMILDSYTASERHIRTSYTAVQRILGCLLLTPLPLHFFSLHSSLRKAALTHVLFIHICRKGQVYVSEMIK